MELSYAIDTSDLTLSVTPASNNQSGQPVTAEQAQILFDSLEDGLTLKESAQAAKMSRQTAWRLMRKYEGSLESASKYLATKALSFVEHWGTASEKAAAKGDHRPAKDALLAIKAIEPVGENAGTNIAILIGTPEQPIRIPSPAITLTADHSET
mgnify:CR=1 FL=1